jgi:hypothetical protein
MGIRALSNHLQVGGKQVQVGGKQVESDQLAHHKKLSRIKSGQFIYFFTSLIELN